MMESSSDEGVHSPQMGNKSSKKATNRENQKSCQDESKRISSAELSARSSFRSVSPTYVDHERRGEIIFGIPEEADQSGSVSPTYVDHERRGEIIFGIPEEADQSGSVSPTYVDETKCVEIISGNPGEVVADQSGGAEVYRENCIESAGEDDDSTFSQSTSNECNQFSRSENETTNSAIEATASTYDCNAITVLSYPELSSKSQSLCNLEIPQSCDSSSLYVPSSIVQNQQDAGNYVISLKDELHTDTLVLKEIINDESILSIEKKLDPSKSSPISFYIPRVIEPPKTADAKKKSLAYLQVYRFQKSSLSSSRLYDLSFEKMRRFSTTWDSITGFSKLHKFSELIEPVLISLKIVDLKFSFFEYVNSLDCLPSIIELFDLLATVSRSKFDCHQANVFETITTPVFLATLSTVISEFSSLSPCRLEKFVGNFVEIYGSIFTLHDALATDGLAADLEKVVDSIKLFIPSLFIEKNDVSEMLRQFLDLLASRHLQLRANSCFPFNILQEETVESNVILGPYQNFDHYISVHYRLLKEDFQNSLRKGLVSYIESMTAQKRRKNVNINLFINIFPDVTLSSQMKKNGLKFKITFNDEKTVKKLRDNPNRNFLNGSLLLMTTTTFENYYLSRVEDRKPLEKNNYIYVDLVLGPPNLFNSMNLLLVEPCQLFEPYYRVMNVLRTLDQRTFPFVRYLVNVDNNVFPPEYLTKSCHLTIGKFKFSLWDDSLWPTHEEIGLNVNQLDGLKLALRNEIAIIQGPPGTGKTFLSRKIIEILLENINLWHTTLKDGPGRIVVVCYKNQSLDQLLNGLVKNGVKVLRIGMQSKEETLNSYNLASLDGPKFCGLYYKMLRNLDEETEGIMNELGEINDVLKTLDAHDGIISFMKFPSLTRLTRENRDYLLENYDNWLVDVGLTPPDLVKINSIVNRHFNWGDDVSEINSTSLYWTSLKETTSLLEKINKVIDPDYPKMAPLPKEESDELHLAADYLIKKEEFLINRLEITKREPKEREQGVMHQLKQQFEQDDQPSLATLPMSKRWVLYKSWVAELRQHQLSSFKSTTSKYQEVTQRKFELRDLITVRKIVQCDARVIGLTTTSAARHSKVLECLKPKIVVVEEAAEVMEAHTVASLSEYCQHLILVGDHQQLRPMTSSYIIGKEANLDISLFERLVRNGFPHCTLNTQYRMRPQISSLVSPFVYPNLLNHQSVMEIPSVLGLAVDVYFVDHTFLEYQDELSLSKHNIHEAEFHVALSEYLIKQGYKPSEITILAMYGEQEKYFKMEILKYPHLEEVIVATVDSFQGKENEIILLSLVRNNAEGNIGFLSNVNRINVALSRAKRGLYITGNASMLTKKSALWRNVIGELRKSLCFGPTLPLKCSIHKNIFEVTSAKHIRALKNGGCMRICKKTLDCQHNCKRQCHPVDTDHKSIYKCIEICKKQMDCSHFCSRFCHFNQELSCFCDSCTPETTCNTKLDCGHICKKPSHKEDYEHQSTFLCAELCNTMLWCGHVCQSLCHTVDRKHKVRYKCPIVCQGLMGCGHPCNLSRATNADHGCTKHHNCSLYCKFVFSCGHECRKLCHRKDWEHKEGCLECHDTKDSIQRSTEKLMKADDTLSSLTPHIESLTITYAPFKAQNECQFVYPCGHPCPLQFGHKKSLHKQCRTLCKFIYSCGHKCDKWCHKERQHRNGCTTLCTITFSCGHSGRVSCKAMGTERQCHSCSTCNHVYSCGHVCLRTKQHKHLDCHHKCNQKLTCGHTCSQKCHKLLDSVAHFCKKKKCKFPRKAKPVSPDSEFSKTICGIPLLSEHVHHDSQHADIANHCSTKVDVNLSIETNKSQSESPLPIDSSVPALVDNNLVVPEANPHKCSFHYLCGHSCMKKIGHRGTHEKGCFRICGSLLPCLHCCSRKCHLQDASPHLCSKGCALI